MEGKRDFRPYQRGLSIPQQDCGCFQVPDEPHIIQVLPFNGDSAAESHMHLQVFGTGRLKGWVVYESCH